MSCRSCRAEIVEFFSLGQMPSINVFLKKEEDFASEKKYNLSVGFCPKCSLVQIIDTIPPKDLFVDYVYFSAVSTHFLEHCKENAAYLTKKLNLGKESLVLEIASNDGSQLQAFKDLGISVLGVDPAKNIAKVANEKGIKTIDEFFSYDLAKKLKEEQNVQADLIFGANVLAHVEGITDFVKGVKELLKPQGTAVFEFPYVRGLVKIKGEGKKVVAYSASAKGTVLLNYFGINSNYINFIGDKAKAKQGLYTPGTHLLVYPPEKISEEKPDYVLILCWNLADEVMEMQELKNWRQDGGKFIIPIPEVKVV